jgi:phosphoglycolate phosphatase-like HAD superfamily hydrolase
VLLRTPEIERVGRNAAIMATIENIATMSRDGSVIDVRFYESLPFLRGVICRRKTDKSSVVLHSTYAWNSRGTSKRSLYYLSNGQPQALRPDHLDAAALSPADCFERWVKYLWGDDEVHTIVFDFDDTLVFTGDIQVGAWIEAIEWALKWQRIDKSSIASQLAEFVDDRRVIGAAGFKRTVEQAFREQQLAQDIAGVLLPRVPFEVLKTIKDRRFEVRQDKMDNHDLDLFPEAERCLQDLALRHRLAIVTSTEESLVRHFLRNRDSHHGKNGGVAGLFSIILGKSDPGLHRSRTIEDKAYLFTKLSVLTGIPLSRMIYVGDNRTDYQSTRQVGMTFIEAKAAACRRDLESMIGPVGSLPEPEGQFSEFANLAGIVAQISYG